MLTFRDIQAFRMLTTKEVDKKVTVYQNGFILKSSKTSRCMEQQ